MEIEIKEVNDIKKTTQKNPISKKTLGKSIKRQSSINAYLNKNKKKSPTIISPYDVEKERYKINLDEIEGTSFKQYYIDTITQLNNNRLFDLKNTNLPVIYPIIFHSFIVIFFVLAVYFSFILFLFSCFNPMIFVIFIYLLRQFYKLLYVIKYLISSKIKRNLMKKVISEENSVSLRDFDIYWELGKECLWIELHQNKLNNAETVKEAASSKENFKEFVEEIE